jgi:biopolymer transport protein ExbD
MAMNVGGTTIKSEINVTPLIDVVLVLLIIFMVVQPMLQVGYEVDTPPKIDLPVPPTPNDDQIIVRMDAAGKAYINKEEIPIGQFGARLGQAMKGRSNQVVFFAADGELPYEKVAFFLDLCRDAGAKKLGMVFDDIKPAPTP